MRPQRPVLTDILYSKHTPMTLRIAMKTSLTTDIVVENRIVML